MRNARTLLFSFLALAPAVAAAQTPPPAGPTGAPPTQTPATSSDPSLEQRVNDLDQRLRVVDRRWEVEQEVLADKKEKERANPPASASASPKAGFSLQSADGNFVLKFRGVIHADGRFFFDSGLNTFLLRRVRPALEGTVFKFFDFRFQPEFAAPASILDAWGNVRLVKELQLRVGKFKGPVGLERLQSPSDLMFAERGLPTNLVPNRDIGAQLHGDLFDGLVNYQVGIFNGVVDGASADLDNNDFKDVNARIFLKPLLPLGNDLFSGFGIGIAGSRGRRTGTLGAYRTPGQMTFFQYADGVVGAGNQQRLSPQASWYVGPLGILAEYVRSRQVVSNGTVTQGVDHVAWQVAASFFVTGESASYTTVTPASYLDPAAGTWGALEITARYGTIEIDRDAFALGFADPERFARSIRAWAVGANWHLAKNFKLVANFERSTFEGGARGGNRPAETVVTSRLQAAF